MLRKFPLFEDMIRNVETGLAKADLTIARRYADLVADAGVRERVFALVSEELERTTRVILRITGQTELLQASPMLAESIRLRNPYIDPMSLIQLDLLRRKRQGEESDELNYAPRRHHQRHRRRSAQHRLERSRPMLLRRVSTPIRAIIKTATLGSVLVAGGTFAAKMESSWRQQCLDKKVWGYAMSGNPAGLQAALASGGNPNSPASPNLAALAEAAQSGNTECVRLLLNCKANPNIRDLQGETPLIYAARYSNASIVTLLLEHGADPNLADNNGDTSLMMAAVMNDVDSLQVLLAAEADPCTPNKQGITPLQATRSWGHIGIANMLQKAGASQ